MSTKTDNRTQIPPLALTPEAAALKPKQVGAQQAVATAVSGAAAPGAVSVETGGPKGPEPTRFGDWERKGRCSDF